MTRQRVDVEHARSSSSSVRPRRSMQQRGGGRERSEQLVLAAEDLGRRESSVKMRRIESVSRSAQREHADVVGRAGAQRDRVGDDDLLEAATAARFS